MTGETDAEGNAILYGYDPVVIFTKYPIKIEITLRDVFVEKCRF